MSRAISNFRSQISEGTLPCLSILQPWAHLTLRGPKRIENRTWGTRMRGSILIHCGLNKAMMQSPAFDEIRAMINRRGYDIELAVCRGGLDRLNFGAILGVAHLSWCTRSRLEAVRKADEINEGVGVSQEVFADEQLPRNCFWVWGAVAAFDRPIPYRGAQGLFNVPASVVESSLEAIGWRVTA